MSASSRVRRRKRQPLVESTALQSVVCDVVPGPSGYPVPTDASSFPTDRGGLPPSPSPVILRCRVHPLVSFVLLQSPVLQSPARCACAPERLPCGLVPLHVNRRVASLDRRGPMPDEDPRALRVYFTALPCPGVHFRGLIPPAWPHHLVGGRHPRAVGGVRLPVARRQRPSRRPQGLAPGQSPRWPMSLFSPPSPVSPHAVFMAFESVARLTRPTIRAVRVTADVNLHEHAAYQVRGARNCADPRPRPTSPLSSVRSGPQDILRTACASPPAPVAAPRG
jgi:hypothetical protein